MIIFVNDHVFELTRIRGPSMYPYLNDRYNETTAKDVCFTWKWYAQNNLQRGMIVTFQLVDKSKIDSSRTSMLTDIL